MYSISYTMTCIINCINTHNTITIIIAKQLYEKMFLALLCRSLLSLKYEYMSHHY